MSTANIDFEEILWKSADKFETKYKELVEDRDVLVDLKKEIISIIKKINNPEQQTLLELRYLCFKTWEQIAVDMGYSIQNAYKVHNRALENISVSKKQGC